MTTHNISNPEERPFSPGTESTKLDLPKHAKLMRIQLAIRKNVAWKWVS
jgi:hypothetical protein